MTIVEANKLLQAAIMKEGFVLSPQNFGDTDFYVRFHEDPTITQIWVLGYPGLPAGWEVDMVLDPNGTIITIQNESSIEYGLSTVDDVLGTERRSPLYGNRERRYGRQIWVQDSR